MHARRAFTLIEVCIACLIVVILAGLVFIAATPSREQARQGVCANQLRQLYLAVSLYGSDYQVAEECPGYEGIALKPFADVKVLDPYIKSRAILFCPDIPSSRSSRFISSYQFLLSMRGDEKDPIDNKLWAQQIERGKQLGQKAPLIRCNVHDEMFYLPRESSLDALATGRFVIDLTLAGSAWKHRISATRSYYFTSQLQ